jgi:hypothetical protein
MCDGNTKDSRRPARMMMMLEEEEPVVAMGVIPMQWI